MSVPGHLSELLIARRAVRDRYGSQNIDELPGEASVDLVGQYANRTPGLKENASLWGELAHQAVKNGEGACASGARCPLVSTPSATFSKSEAEIAIWTCHGHAAHEDDERPYTMWSITEGPLW